MSGSLDESTAQKLASGRQTLGSMLSAAQQHLQKVFIVFVIALVGMIWALRAFLWDTLETDLVRSQMSDEISEVTEIVAVNPFEVILIQIKIGAVVGILVTLPMIIWYSRHALKRRGFWPDDSIPRWKIVSFVVATAFLFLVGIAYAYFLFFPIMFNFLAKNAHEVGFKPTWSIAMWTEFILFLGLSFGIAAQLPLAMSAAARTGIVPYETFRDKWRYAVVAIFVFGAMFSPPDPFTQLMWGVPLVALYGISLGFTKLAVLSKQVGKQVPIRGVAQTHWNKLAGTFLVAAVAMYFYLLEGGLEETNSLLAAIGSDYRFPGGGQLGAFGLSSAVVGTAIAVAFGLLALGVTLFYFRIKALEAKVQQTEAADDTPAQAGEPAEKPEPDAGEKAEIDIGAMSAQAIRAAPPEAFQALTSEQVLHYAEQAVENENHEKGQAILDSYDEAQELEGEETEEEDEESSSIVTSTAAGVFDSFTEDETTEDDIGGYYYDIAFILDSLTSRAIWVVGVFMAVLAGTFGFLYTGGIRWIREQFAKGMPGDMGEQLEIVTLHPVEALIFMLKFSTLLAAISVVPIILYFAWPAIEERGVSTGDRNILLVWGGSILLSLVGGTLLGFLYIAPAIISLLAQDVVTSSMVIAYRINSFGWLVLYFTTGIGVLTLIPTTMVLFHHGNIVSYRRMRKSWRGAVVGFFAAAGLFSPNGLFTMFLVAIPASLAYVFGLGLLWVYTRVGSKAPRRHGETAD